MAVQLRVALKGYPAVRQELKKHTFLYTDAVLSAEDQARINEMALMLTDQSKLDQFRNWSERAKHLGITLDRIDFYRRTPAFQTALRDAVKMRALESAVTALGAMEAKANEGDVKAYDKLLQVAEMKSSTGTQVQINNTQNNMSLSYEQRLTGLLEERVGAEPVTVEALPVDPGQETGAKPEPEGEG